MLIQRGADFSPHFFVFPGTDQKGEKDRICGLKKGLTELARS